MNTDRPPPSIPPVTEANLPELQLLHLLNPMQRNAAITNALRALPYLRQVRPCHVVKRYGLSPVSAVAVIDRAKGRSYAKFGATRYPEKAA